LTDPAAQQYRKACIFPAFGADFLGNEKEILAACAYDFTSLIARAEAVVDFRRSVLDENPDGMISDELQSQYATYLYSCAVSDILASSGVPSDYCAGYSMGIYAALYHCGSCSLEDGLRMIREAYALIREGAAAYDFGMGVVVGPDLGDLGEVIGALGADVEIINVNNRHSFSIAGIRADVVAVLEKMREEGALNVRLLSMTAPYHSRYMDGAASRFRSYCEGISLSDPAVPVVSTVDRKLLRSRGDVIADLSRNINNNINWHETMSAMVHLGVNCFYECGPGKTLQKLSKFIDGEFTVITMKKLAGVVAEAGTRQGK